MVYRTHGLSGHELYPTWVGMLRRCENPDDPGYKNYGGRGIAVCKRWHNVALFITDIEDMIGPRPPGYTIERIDNDGDYEPGNVKWADRWEQRHNQRKQCNGPFSVIPPHRPRGRWLPAPGYAGWYEVSDAGEVFSMRRGASGGGLLDLQVNSRGYRQASLCKYGKVQIIPVGRLVLLTFRGPPPRSGAKARHGTGGPLDDSLPNLWWG